MKVLLGVAVDINLKRGCRVKALKKSSNASRSTFARNVVRHCTTGILESKLSCIVDVPSRYSTFRHHSPSISAEEEKNTAQEPKAPHPKIVLPAHVIPKTSASDSEASIMAYTCSTYILLCFFSYRSISQQKMHVYTNVQFKTGEEKRSKTRQPSPSKRGGF